MESHTIPKVAFLSEENREELTDALKKLCSPVKMAILHKQLDTLTICHDNIRSFNETSLFSNRLMIISNYLSFANALVAYAGTQEVVIDTTITTALTQLTEKLTLLEKKKIKNEMNIDLAEEAHRAKIASARKDSAPRKPLHTRSGSNLGRLIDSLSKLDKDQTRLFAKMAEVANDLIRDNLVLAVIDAQLSQLQEKDIRMFCNADLDIRSCQTEKALDAYFSRVKKWLDEKDIILMALNKSLALIKKIGYGILAELISNQKIKKYKALYDGADTIRRRLPNSEMTTRVMNNLERILDFLPNIEKLNKERLKVIHKQEKEKHTSQEHKRERSKSEGFLVPTGAKITFFTSQLRKGTSAPLPRQASGKLPTKWREKPENKRRSMAVKGSKF